MTERGGLQSTDRLLAPAVAETLTALGLDSVDLAASKLAERYARELDQAAAIAAAADRVLALARDAEPEDVELHEQLAALRNRLTARQALADLGPKLLAALTELGASPKARAAMAKGGASSGRSAGGKLAALREGRAG